MRRLTTTTIVPGAGGGGAAATIPAAHAEADVAAAAAGDREAFVRLVAAYANTVGAIAVAASRDLDAAQDVAQEVFLVAWRDLRKLRNPASFLPWLRQIARNRARQWRRDQRLGRRARDADEALAAAVSPHPTPHEALALDGRRRMVREVVDELPDDVREVIALFYLEGRSVRQVADLLGIAEPAVRKRLSRARAAIREELLDRFGEEVRASAPAPAVAAAVGLAIAAGSPATVGGGLIAAGQLGGGTVLAKLAGGLGGGALGAGIAAFAVRRGVGRHLAQALDARESAELERFGRTALAAVVLAAAGMGLAGLLGSAGAVIFVHALFLGTLSRLYLGRLPRILGRRLAAERAGDPAAAARQRRDRQLAWLAVLAGAAVSSATVVFVALHLLD